MNRKVDHKIILAKKKLRKLSKNYKQNFKNIENYIKKEIYEIKRSNKLSNNIIPEIKYKDCLLYTSPSPRDRQKCRMPSSA